MTMRTTTLSALITAGLLGGVGTLVVDTTPAHAQSSTTGAVRGQIKDKANGETVIGATVVATSNVLQGQQVVITDENGLYFIDSLPPGTYSISVFYGDDEKPKISRGNVLIQVGKQSVVNIPIDTSGGETIVVEGRAPIVDQGSTKTGVTINDEYTTNVPVIGRTFGGVLGTAPGSQGDIYGISFGGAGSAENTYIVEGINTTDTGFGLLSSNLPNEFVQETEVITGGYNAEFGRATGGIVNVVTKQGTNEFKGSVYSYYTPGALVAEAQEVKREGQAIDVVTNLDYRADFGAELGGPIIKDKLWFHVGFNPSFASATLTRNVGRLVDRDGDGAPDVDDETGLTLTDTLSSRDYKLPSRTLYFTAKINGAVTQDHQFQISAFGNPRHAEDYFGFTRNPEYVMYQYDDGAYDLAGKWTSKFADGKTQVDAVLGFHRGFEDQRELVDAHREDATVFYNYTRSLYDFQSIEGGDAAVAGCNDGMAADPLDPTNSFRNCPVLAYTSQGYSFFEDRTNDRRSGILSLTQRVKAAGYHTFKVGADVEFSTYDSGRRYGGDIRWRRNTPISPLTGLPQVANWQRRELLDLVGNLDDAQKEDPNYDPNADPRCTEPGQCYVCSEGNALCQLARGGIEANTNNRGLAAYIQDSWQIRPNLTLNAGLRWEQQIGYVAEDLQGSISPEGELIPEEAYKLNNLLAPRVGLIFDPTQEGRSKLFAHWGRFYESVPMDINVRAFGGEITNFTTVGTPRTAFDANCNVDFGDANDDGMGGSITDRLEQCQNLAPSAALGGGTEFVQPGLEGQYIQELVLGSEYELAPDFKMGVSYIHRTLPVAIEDISVDGGNHYLIANPGSDASDAAAETQAEADRLRAMGEDELADLFESRAAQLAYVGEFDKPIRNYDALQVTANQRPTKNSLLLGSYTYSRSKGNYPGLFSTETGQLDPNLTSLFDLPDLMANRFGPLGHDRPHLVKLDGFYQFDLKNAGILTLGASFRAQSGIAHNALAAHPTYGPDESYLVSRGAIRRSPVTWEADVKTQYGRKLGKDMRLELFADIFNLFNNQEETDIDETYTRDDVVPIVGGEQIDLDHAKISSTDVLGVSYMQNATPAVNKNFGRLSARQAPLSMRFGLRLTF
jgi:hypothetical protein